MHADSKTSYPGLAALIAGAVIAVATGAVCIGLTVLRANARLWPVVTEPDAYLPANDLSNVYFTWYGAGIAILLLGLIVGTAAVIAKIRTAGRFTPHENGKVWVGIVGPVAVLLLAAGILALPLTVESRMRHLAHENGITQANARIHNAAGHEADQQQRNAKAEAKADGVSKAIDALTDPDPSTRGEAIHQLTRSVEIRQPNPQPPYDALRTRLLTTIDQHWRTICNSDQIASDLYSLSSMVDRQHAKDWFDAWQTERMTLLDPQSTEWKNSLTVADDAPHLQALKRYCDFVGKSAIPTDRKAISLYGQAVNRSFYKSAEVLLDAGMPVDTVAEGKAGTPLTSVCERIDKAGSLEMLTVLLKHGANPNAKNSNSSALLLLIQKKNVEALNLLLDAKADPNAEIRGEAILFQAVQQKNLEAVEALLKHGANTAVRSSNRPILFMAVHSDEKIVEALLKAKADPNASERPADTPLSEAVDAKKPAIVALLLKYGANPNVAIPRKSSLLERAIAQDDAEMVKALLAGKAEVNTKDPWKKTPLMNAVERKNEQIVALLIAAKANLNETNSEEQTALSIAAASGQDAIVKTLLEAKADPNIKDISGRTALFHAVGKKSETIVDLLIANKADVNAADTLGRTALWYAVALRQTKIVPKLLDAKANPNLKDQWGKTILDYLNPSATGDEATIISKLKAHGATPSPSPPKSRPDESSNLKSM